MADEIKTAGQMMQAMSQSIPKAPMDLLLEKPIKRIQYTGANQYQYCPFCLERVRRGGGDYHAELKPLWIVTYKMLVRISQAQGQIMYEKRYECEKCRKEITIDDFLAYHSTPVNFERKTPVVNLNDTAALERF